MSLWNSSTGFGMLTRLLHWATAIAVLIALPLGLWISEMQVTLASLKYYGIHKSIGFTILLLTLFRLAWHRISPVPPVLGTGGWQDQLARIVHRLLYLCLVLMPLSGWAASAATGIDTVIFGRWTLPRIAPVSEEVEALGFAVHGAMGLVLSGLITVHVLGALYRAFVVGDRTFARMLRG